MITLDEVRRTAAQRGIGLETVEHSLHISLLAVSRKSSPLQISAVSHN